MSRYIDADAIRLYWLENGENEYVYDTNAFLDSIDNAPTADVAPVVHAYWIGYETMSWRNGRPKRRKYNRCSNCRTASAVRHKACPNCRAIMDADTQEREGGK